MLQTERLYIKPTTLADAPLMLAIFNSPGWLKYIGDRNVHSIAETETYLSTRLVGSCVGNGCGMYTIFLKENDVPIGTSTLVKRDYLEHADIGYALLAEYEGNGYATEASKALLSYAINELGHKTVVGICLKSHTASIRVLEKIGLCFKNEFEESGDEMVLMITE